MNEAEFIAKIRHMCWCSYQMGADQEFNEKINDDQLESLINGVQAQLDNPDMTPEENHDNWWYMKINQGWRHGYEKDFERKTHPDMVPYQELPEVERKKDNMDIMAHRGAKKLWEDMVDDR